MRVRIHRGAHEIGGSCVEVEHDGKRIVLDLGRPLTAGWDDDVAMPDVAGLDAPDADLLGVVISHGHADHWGLVDQVAHTLPIHMGAATERILAAAAFWTRGLDVPIAGHLEHRRPFELGPFTITPYLNDHSAYDAYSLLVEAGGRRLFYTGDIRGHGRKAGLFEQLLADPPRDVDVLLMEGTNVQPAVREPAAATESAVEDALAEQFRSTDGMALVVSAAQNIDRLVTIYRACLRVGRDLVIDPYTADVARATGNPNIPRPGPDWPRIHTYMPRWQSIRIRQTEQFDRLGDINPYRLFPEDLAADPARHVLLFHRSEGPRLATAGALVGATCTWSLWRGYLEQPSGVRFWEFLEEHGIPLAHRHTSGHATPADLRRLAAVLRPGRVVPIHTEGPEHYGELLDGVPDLQPDGRWWEV